MGHATVSAEHKVSWHQKKKGGCLREEFSASQSGVPRSPGNLLELKVLSGSTLELLNHNPGSKVQRFVVNNRIPLGDSEEQASLKITVLITWCTRNQKRTTTNPKKSKILQKRKLRKPRREI